jgi:hypothetical protein
MESEAEAMKRSRAMLNPNGQQQANKNSMRNSKNQNARKQPRGVDKKDNNNDGDIETLTPTIWDIRHHTQPCCT